MATKRKPLMVPVFPDVSDVTEESAARILKACEAILDLCAELQLTISDVQSLPEMLCGEIRRAVHNQVANETFRNVKERSE